MKEQKNPIAIFSFVILVLIFLSFLALSGENREVFTNLERDMENENRLKIIDPENMKITPEPIDADASFSFESQFSTGDGHETTGRSVISINYSFPAPMMNKKGKYDIPMMSGLQNQENPGMPSIPVKNAQILLPQGEILENLEVSAKNEVALKGIYFIQPCGQPMTFGTDNQSLPQKKLDLTIYNSEERYPEDLYKNVTIVTFRGFNILILKLYPMHYIPAQGEVLYFENIDITVTTLYTGEQSPLYRGLPKDRKLVNNVVDNPSVLATYGLKNEVVSTRGIVPASITNQSESYNYVIITNSTLAPSFQSLANYKNGTGIETIVVKIEDILSDPDYEGVDNQTRIRNFIIDAYNNWSIGYVLLGGDDEIIPHRGCFGKVGSDIDDDIPTDLYYGGLDGNWDNDGDGIYGEKSSAIGGGGDSGEESDLYAEVYVGRTPVNTTEEVQTFVNKTKNFESNQRPKHVTLHGALGDEGEHIDFIKNGGDGTLAAPGVESYIPSNYNITRLYESEGDAIDVTIWEMEIANDTLFINHGGHGNVEHYEIKNGLFYLDTYADDVENDCYPIHLSTACYSGAFDGRRIAGSYVLDRDCIAEEYITNPNGGMVACILNSRYGWSQIGDVTKFSGELDNEFYNQLFNNNVIYIGKTLQKTKEEFASRALSNNIYRWVVYEWNLLGDPTLQILEKDTVPPVADAGPDNSTDEDSPIVLDGSSSTDDSGYIAWYNWTFGDGDYFNGMGPENATVVHIYIVPGNYMVILNVSDAWGNWDCDIVNITVYDATPPVTDLILGDPKHRNNVVDDWNVTQITPFFLSASDDYSNVSFTWYTIDGEYFEGSLFDLTGYDEGQHYITWGSEDEMCNNETGNSMIVWIDESTPVTSLEIGNPKYPLSPANGCNVTSSTMLTLNAQDHPSHNSGVKFSWYVIDSDYYEGMVFNLLGYNEGLHIITWGSADNLGHNETTNTMEVWIDDSVPETELTIGLPIYPSFPYDGCNVTSTSQFTLSGVDKPEAHNAGIDFIWYIIDGNYYAGASFNFSGYGEGLHLITWGSQDYLGNNEAGNSVTVWVDNSAPVTDLSIGLLRYPSSPCDGCNVTSTTQFTLSGIDKPEAHNAGIDFAWYLINGDYYVGASFNLLGYGEGSYLITWGSQDCLGNNETDNSITVWVDNSAPETDPLIGLPRYPSSPYDGCNVTSSTQFTLSGVDKPGAHNSSIGFTWYLIDDDYYVGISFNLSGYGEGLHVITWGSEDCLGNNETGKSITVFVDDSAPETDLTMGLPRYPLSPYYGCNVTSTTQFMFSSVDKPDARNVGIDFTWYMIDGDYHIGTTFNLSNYGEGSHLITWGSQDCLGNNETDNSITVWVDNSAPETDPLIGLPRYPSSPYDGCNVTSSTQFTLSGVDKPNSHNASIDFTWYAIGDDCYVGTSFNLSGYGEGLHVITWGSEDCLGNNETGKSITVFVDDSAPETDLTIGLPRYPLSPYYGCNVSSTTQFTLYGGDKPHTHNAGIDFIWFKIDGDYYIGTSFNLSGYGEGLHVVTWGGQDHLGNNETDNSITIWVDNSAPETDPLIELPRYPLSPYDDCNVSSATQFTLSGMDKPGVHNVSIYFIWFIIDGDYHVGTSFNLSGYGEGSHVITWGGQDHLGNNETDNSITVFVDDSRPETTLTIGTPRYPLSPYDGCNVTSTTQFTLSGVDKPDAHNASIDYIWFMIDDDYHVGTSFNLSDYADGLHTIIWGSVDHLGFNETNSPISVNLNTTSPRTNLTIDAPKYRDSESDSWNVTSFSIFALDPISTPSCINFSWFTIDGHYFEGENFTLLGFIDGLHSITWGTRDVLEFNETGNFITVLLDNTEPSTIIDLGEPKLRAIDIDEWNVTHVTIFSLNCTDRYSGVNHSWYVIDGEYFEGTTFNLSKYDDGLYTINYGAIDNLGNNKTDSYIIIYLDTTPPTTLLNIGDAKYRNSTLNHWNVTTGSELSLSSSDSRSGVNYTWYTIDGNYFEGTIFNLSKYNKEGLYNITWGGVDYLGNNESGNIMTINLDNSTPITHISIGIPKHRARDIDYWNITQSTELWITNNSDGTGSGIDFVWYTIGEVFFEYSTPFTLTSGVHTISWGGIDNLGLNETGNIITVVVDVFAPTTDLTIDSPKFRAVDIDIWNVTHGTIFNLTSIDQLSGLAYTWYTIDGTYFKGHSFKLEEYDDGLHTIAWGGEDNLGNNETGNSIMVILDTTSPVTYLNIGTPKYRGSVDDIWNVRDDSVFSLIPSDLYSGVAFTWYTINSQYFEGTNFTFSGYDDGEFTITWGSHDNLGNSEHECTLTVNLDTTPPLTRITIGSRKFRENENDPWNVTSDVIFILTSSDKFSGVNLTWYRVDGIYHEGLEFQLQDYDDGLHTITLGSSDYLNNTEKENVMIINLDNTPPSISVGIGSPHSIIDEVPHLTSETPITLIALDSGVGLTSLYYSLDEGITYSNYTTAFFVSPTTTSITYGGEDALNNQVYDLTLYIVVDDTDTDSDGIYDLIDDDDDNDGMLDIMEDVNQNRIVDKGETDPKNPDTDGDGHYDNIDRYPLDENNHKEPNDWEKLPIIGGYERSFCFSLAIIAIIVLILLIYINKQYKIWKTRKSWKKEPEEYGKSQR